MDTVTVSLDEAARDLPSIIRALRANGNRVVLTDAGERLAEIAPVVGGPNTEPPAEPGPRVGPRWVIDEISGHPVVAARPGARKITNEDVRRWLGDLP